MHIAYLRSLVVLIPLLSPAKGRDQRHGREAVRTTDQSGLALVRYIQLHRQCSEDVAYERLTTFVKSQSPFHNQFPHNLMRDRERQEIVKHALSILAHSPDDIDSI